MNQTTGMICLMAKELADSTPYRLILIFKTILCLLGVLGTAYCAKREGTKWLVHPNAKVIFSFHLILATYVPLSYCLPFVFDLIRLSAIHENPCDYTISMKSSIIIRLVPVIGLVAQSFVMCALSIKRSISTICASSYEKIREPTLGLALSGIAVLLSCFQNYMLIVRPINWDSIQFITTVRTRENADSYQTQLYTFMSVEFVTIIVLAITLLKNRQMSKKKLATSYALSNKYQLKENSLVIITLLPCFIVHFCLNLWSSFGITLWLKFYGSYDPIDNAVCIETMSHGQMYSLIMPVLILYRLRKKRNTVIVNDYRNMDSHFKQITTYW